MSCARLVLAGLRHHARAHAGAGVGFAVATAVLVGALAVGDSVRGSLRGRALARIGEATSAVAAPERFFRAALAQEIAEELGDSRVAAALLLDGHASSDRGDRRANDVSLLGIEPSFLELAPGESAATPPAAREVLLSDVLAERLATTPGDEVVVRVATPSDLPRDMVLAPTEESTVGLRLRVAGIVGPDEFARFALAAGPRAPANAFVDLAWLQGELGLEGRANLLLLEAPADEGTAALAERWTLEDVPLETRPLDGGGLELRTPRVFLDPAVGRAAAQLGRPALGVLTYFVNALVAGERATPYSMVTAVGPLGEGAPGIEAPWVASGELVVNEWLANDLGVAAGDPVELRYFVPGPDRSLEQATRPFPVGRVIPIEGAAADPTWAPSFPGLEGEEDCRDWEPGIPLDLSVIRDEDEAYWDEHRGTPKAFLTLDVGRELWASRFGDLTAIRAPDPDGDWASLLRDALDPAQLGLVVRDLRGPALAGASTPTDFGGLFLGLSFFLIAAALLLASLLFVFGVERRAREVGALLAMGWPRRSVRRLFLAEAALVAAAGCLVGALLGLGYTQLVLRGLATLWRDAVASTPITFHAGAGTLIGGTVGAWIAALLAVRWALRGLMGREAVALLAARWGVSPETPEVSARRARRSSFVAVGALLAALAIAVWADASRGSAAAGAFFGAGAALLVAGLAGCRALLARRSRRVQTTPSVAALGRAGVKRRPARSLATIALLASGTFLVVSIGVHRKGALPDPTARASGTGGFALIGDSTLPVHHDLNAPEGRDAFGLTAADLEGVSVLSLAVRDGDDASCLNIGAPQVPRLLGVDPAELARRGAFRFAEVEGGEGFESPWELLLRERDDGAVPVVGDAASVRWTLKRSLGDEVELVDGLGRPLRLRIVATLAGSFAQGSLVLGEEAFRAHFPGVVGAREFWIDAPPERSGPLAEDLTRALGEAGLALEPAAVRIEAYNALHNAYLDIFQLLGALGVLLGSLGVGVVVLRNGLERRGELALLGAIGFRRRELRRLLFSEHAALVALGLGVGVGAALLALVPVLGAAEAGVAPGWLGGLVVAMALNGVLWTVAACWGAARGVGLSDLRGE